MTSAELAIKRPIFISCIVILILALGYLSLKKLPVDLFPDVSFPTVVVSTIYAGAGPEEIETEVSKVIENEVSSISGINKISSINKEGESDVIVEFNLNVDIRYAEQQVRAKVDNVRRNLPEDVDASVIKTVSVSDAPIMAIALNADLPDGKIFDLADDVIKPQFEQVNQVGDVKILGGRKREIHVNLDREKLRAHQISATQIAAALRSSGRNIPSGKTDSAESEHGYRTMGVFPTVDHIKRASLFALLMGDAITVGDVGTVTDDLVDETTRTYLNGKKAVIFQVYRQSGANTVKVADEVKAKLEKINTSIKSQAGSPKMTIYNDRSRLIRSNVEDVYVAIILGIVLTVIVVYLFLGSVRSTLITGFALPNSLLGAFVLMSVFGFSINIMSLLALSLVVGLLVDDAIVVRENIYRKIEHGMDAMKAALLGTNEVSLAVIATTFTVLAVFGPIGNLKGIVGQFFKQFGLTVCFAMAVSLFDALTVAPMLSAYFAGSARKTTSTNIFLKYNIRLLDFFNRLQANLEDSYVSALTRALKRPAFVLLAGLGLFIGSLFVAKHVPFTFISAQDNGEFTVSFDLPPGTSLEATDTVAHKIDTIIHKNAEVRYTAMNSGSETGAANEGSIYVRLVDHKDRSLNTSQVKENIRQELKEYSRLNIKVADVDAAGSKERQFNLNITGANLDEIKAYSDKILEKIKDYPGLKDVDTSFRTGKPETRVVLDELRSREAVVSKLGVGQELRTQVEGTKAGVYRENGREYDIRVRIAPEQRDLLSHFPNVYVPNFHNKPIRLSYIAKIERGMQPTSILRENRTRYIQISADVAPGGPGLGGAMKELTRLMGVEMPPPPGISYSFVGQAERFAELAQNIVISMGLGMLFIYLVLASLYESFITPFAIMLVIPLAACGAFVALFVARASFDLFSMIGCVMLMGLATKNSILLIDYTLGAMREGRERSVAIVAAGKARLRPILMTSLAMIAGMIPVAIGLSESAKSRTSLGIVVVGGTISSTLLTLFIIPAAFIYINRFQVWFFKIFNRFFRPELEIIEGKVTRE